MQAGCTYPLRHRFLQIAETCNGLCPQINARVDISGLACNCPGIFPTDLESVIPPSRILDGH